MNHALELINEVRQTGVILRADPPDLVLDPAGRISPALKARLREHKADVLRHLELEASMRRLEASNVLLAISDDGVLLRVVQSDNDAHQATADGFAIFTPQDAHIYIQLSERERRILHSFKKRFGGSIEWRETDVDNPNPVDSGDC